MKKGRHRTYRNKQGIDNRKGPITVAYYSEQWVDADAFHWYRCSGREVKLNKSAGTKDSVCMCDTIVINLSQLFQTQKLYSNYSTIIMLH